MQITIFEKETKEVVTQMIISEIDKLVIGKGYDVISGVAVLRKENGKAYVVNNERVSK